MCFLKQQDRLFPEPVAEGMEEAEAFLEDCMAVVVDSKAAVMEYFEEAGIDVENPDQVLDEAEVSTSRWALPDRRRIKAN